MAKNRPLLNMNSCKRKNHTSQPKQTNEKLLEWTREAEKVIEESVKFTVRSTSTSKGWSSVMKRLQYAL